MSNEDINDKFSKIEQKLSDIEKKLQLLYDTKIDKMRIVSEQNFINSNNVLFDDKLPEQSFQVIQLLPSFYMYGT